jgi:hypothetical protein
MHHSLLWGYLLVRIESINAKRLGHDRFIIELNNQRKRKLEGKNIKTKPLKRMAKELGVSASVM